MRLLIECGRSLNIGGGWFDFTLIYTGASSGFLYGM